MNEYGQRLVDVQAAEAVAMVQVPSQEAEVPWRQAAEPESDCMSVYVR
jgi:hypothetical protein